MLTHGTKTLSPELGFMQMQWKNEADSCAMQILTRLAAASRFLQFSQATIVQRDAKMVVRIWRAGCSFACLLQ